MKNLLQIMREMSGKSRMDVRIELGYKNEGGVRALESRPLSNMNLDTIMMFAHACDCDVELTFRSRTNHTELKGRVGNI